MDILNQKLKLLRKRKNKYLILGLLLLIGSILSFIWYYQLEEKLENTNISLHERITHKEEEEGNFVSLQVTERPFLFAEYEEEPTSDKFYFLMDEDYLYIGYLDYYTYLELNTDDILEHPITLKGFTKKIPEDVKKIAIEVYNEELEETILTEENFSEYLGLICIDTVRNSSYGMGPLMIGIGLFIASIIYFIFFLIRLSKWKEIEKMPIWENVKKELESSTCINYDKMHLFLTDHYIVDGSRNLVIIPYQDIVWLYPYEQKYNGITHHSCLMVALLSRKKKKIAVLSGLSIKLKEQYSEIIQNIYQKNPSMLIGYTEENKQQAKDLYQIK